MGEDFVIRLREFNPNPKPIDYALRRQLQRTMALLAVSDGGGGILRHRLSRGVDTYAHTDGTIYIYILYSIMNRMTMWEVILSKGDTTSLGGWTLTFFGVSEEDHIQYIRHNITRLFLCTHYSGRRHRISRRHTQTRTRGTRYRFRGCGVGSVSCLLVVFVNNPNRAGVNI